jgi:hypothetical protein
MEKPSGGLNLGKRKRLQIWGLEASPWEVVSRDSCWPAANSRVWGPDGVQVLKVKARQNLTNWSRSGLEDLTNTFKDEWRTYHGLRGEAACMVFGRTYGTWVPIWCFVASISEGVRNKNW